MAVLGGCRPVGRRAPGRRPVALWRDGRGEAVAAPGPPAPTPASAAASERRPSVIVSGVDVTHRVQGAKNRSQASRRTTSRSFVGSSGAAATWPPCRPWRRVKTSPSWPITARSIGIIGRKWPGKSTYCALLPARSPRPRDTDLDQRRAPPSSASTPSDGKLTGERNIYVGGQVSVPSRARARARFEDIVEFSGIGGSRAPPDADRYSSGQAGLPPLRHSTAAAPTSLMIDEGSPGHGRLSTS